MSKTTMVCPFSKELCRDCSIYRGRHYYFCFNKKYKGTIADCDINHIKKDIKKVSNLRGVSNFDMPLHITPSPTWLKINKLIERTYYNNS